MSDNENDASVLGKRSRNGQDAEDREDPQVKTEDVEERPDQAMDEDDDDDDVGPMPMPADAEVHVAKKKRKGERTMPLQPRRSEQRTEGRAVLPHEKLYLDHLPSADRYYKSFMHRDVINFCIMTRCVPHLLPPASDDSIAWRAQDGVPRDDVYRRHCQAVEEAGTGH